MFQYDWCNSPVWHHLILRPRESSSCLSSAGVLRCVFCCVVRAAASAMIAGCERASISDLICSRVVTQAGLKCSIITVFFCFLAAYSMWPGLIESLMFISNFLLSASLHSLGMLIIILTLFYICQWNVHTPFKVRKGSPHSKLVFKNQPHNSFIFILPTKCNYCKRTWPE